MSEALQAVNSSAERREVDWIAVSAIGASVAGLSGAFCWIAQAGGEWSLSQPDAYVHLAVARNLVENGQWSLIGSPPHGASSSPLVVLAMCVLEALGMSSIPSTMGLACVGSGVAASAGAWAMSKAGWSGARLWGGAFLLALCGRLVPLATTGLEHAWFAAAAIVLLVALWQEEEARPPLAVVGVAAACAVGLRPEGLPLVALLTLLAAISGRSSTAKALLAGSLFASVMGVATHLLAGGGVLPFASSAGFVTKYAPDSMASILELARQYPAFLVVALGAGVLGCAQTGRRRAALLATLAGLAVFQLAWGWVGNYYRYEAWLVTSICTVALVSLARESRGWARGGALVTLVAAAAAGVPAFSLAVDGVAWNRKTTHAMAELVVDVHESGPVVVSGGGLLAWAYRIEVIDSGCRTTPHLACSGRRPEPMAAKAALSTLGAQGALLPVDARPAYLPESWSLSDQWLVADADRAVTFSLFLPQRWGWRTSHDLVQDRDGRLVFYVNGTATFETTTAVEVELSMSGTQAIGDWPVARVELGARSEEYRLSGDKIVLALPVVVGDVMTVSFINDVQTPDGSDRNLFVDYRVTNAD